MRQGYERYKLHLNKGGNLLSGLLNLKFNSSFVNKNRMKNFDTPAKLSPMGADKKKTEAAAQSVQKSAKKVVSAVSLG
jgi:hypothetical protein